MNRTPLERFAPIRDRASQSRHCNVHYRWHFCVFKIPCVTIQIARSPCFTTSIFSSWLGGIMPWLGKWKRVCRRSWQRDPRCNTFMKIISWFQNFNKYSHTANSYITSNDAAADYELG